MRAPDTPPSRPLVHHLPRVAAIGAIAIVPLVPGVPDFWITLAGYIGLSSLVAIGLVLLTGVGGMTSFGQAAFVGFGAYTTAVLTKDFGVSPWLTLPASLATTGAMALLIGAVTVRLSGHFLPLGTIAWGIAFFYLFGNVEALGRFDGINGIPPLDVLGIPLIDARAVFYPIWIAVILAVILSENLLDSRMGRAIRALRDGRLAAESFGIDTARVKLVVFVYAALLAGLSGWLYAHVQRAVSPSPFGLNAGIEYLLMAVLGGAGHVLGGVLGAGIVTLLKDQLQDILPKLIGADGSFETIVFGILMVVVLQVARDGLWPLVMRLLPKPPPKTVAAGVPLPARTMPDRGSPLLAMEKARKQFGGLVAVNDVSFEVKAGEIVGLIGPNGAGKSTTFNLLTGVLPATTGEITLSGERIERSSARAIARRGVARTFQHVKLARQMTVLENVALGAHLRGSKGVVAAMLRLDRADETRLLGEATRQLDRVGLGAHLHKPATSLALGQQRVAEIARALCLDPQLLLLDEPAAGLRFAEKQQLGALLARLRDEGVSILLVEHDMDFVMKLTDHIVVLDFGKKIAEGPPAAVAADPAVLEAYLGGVE
ncbi:ABC transporter permease subunit [Rhodoplanes sp. SY1]|uniref:branched-chain amino acid ABC transporter ATP-binding protein/permease n=1 Tax=Rhodoplanes sp. SY1 TaxID=3166646 RepID=UPI0038B5DD63